MYEKWNKEEKDLWRMNKPWWRGIQESRPHSEAVHGSNLLVLLDIFMPLLKIFIFFPFNLKIYNRKSKII